MPSKVIQIRKSSLIEILNERDLYTEDQLTLDKTSHNARQIVAALAGMLSFDDEEIANLLAKRIGLTPTHNKLPQETQVVA